MLLEMAVSAEQPSKMKLIAVWGEKSDRVDELLKSGCRCCDSRLGRLVRHFAGNGFQAWVSCAGCAAKVHGPIPHSELRRWRYYPMWRSDMTEELEPEEILELKPITISELLEEIRRAPALVNVLRAFESAGVIVGSDLDESDLPDIANVMESYGYAVAKLSGAARLLKFEDGFAQILTPHRRGKQLDLTDRTTIKLTWKTP